MKIGFIGCGNMGGALAAAVCKKVGSEKTDTDLLIGRQVKVEEDIDNSEEKGAVRVNGQIWSARMENDLETAKVGEFVTVQSISGVKLICRKN